MQSEKSSVRVVRHAQLEFSPRFEYGDMAQVADVCGEADGSELGVGDCIWLPDGTELIYEAESALIHFAIHPANWQNVT